VGSSDRGPRGAAARPDELRFGQVRRDPSEIDYFPTDTRMS
jgi:hypothetical protein